MPKKCSNANITTPLANIAQLDLAMCQGVKDLVLADNILFILSCP